MHALRAFLGLIGDWWDGIAHSLTHLLLES